MEEELRRLKNLLKQKNEEIEIRNKINEAREREKKMKKKIRNSQKKNEKGNENKSVKPKFNRKEWLSKRLNRRNRLYKKKTLRNNIHDNLKEEILSHLPAGKSSLFLHSLPVFNNKTRTGIYTKNRLKRTNVDKGLLFYEWWDDVLDKPSFDLNSQLNIFTEEKNEMDNGTFLNVYRRTQQELFYKFTEYLEEFVGIPNPNLLINGSLVPIRDLQFYKGIFKEYYFNEQKKTMEEANKMRYENEEKKKQIMIELLETQYGELGEYFSGNSEKWAEEIYDEFNDLYTNSYTYQNFTSLIKKYMGNEENKIPNEKIYILYHWLSNGFFDPYPNIEYNKINFSILMQRFMFMTNFNEVQGQILSPYYIYILNSFYNRLSSSDESNVEIIKSEIFTELLFLLYPMEYPMEDLWDIYREYIDYKFIEEETIDYTEGINLQMDKDILYWIKIWKVLQLIVYDFDFNGLPIEYTYREGGGFGSKNFLVTKAKDMYQGYGGNADNIEDPLYGLFQKIDEFEINESNYYIFINLFAELPHYLLCAVGM